MWNSLADILFQVYTNRLADQLYKIGLLRRAWTIWRSVSHTKWKETMEKACQSSAESVRIELSNDYENKLQEVRRLLKNFSFLSKPFEMAFSPHWGKWDGR